MNSNQETPYGLMILGMHRSGTSAVASLFQQLGFHCGKHPMPPQPANPRGYFEDRLIVDAHDRFLTQNRTAWSDPRPLPELFFAGTLADETKQELASVMSDDFLTHDRWVMKDPRLCRLMPLWRAWADQHSKNAPLGFLHVLRSPRSVIRSLERREGFGAKKGALLWLRHYLESEISTRGRNRTWLSFEDLASRGGKALAKAISRLDGWPSLESHDLDRAFSESFSSDLVHHGDEEATAPNRDWDHPWIVKSFR
ncbi:MAG: hypothetical protein K8J08_04425, partial [Thermoanaerobaculia bacterium]|nr:hypothetical protein [Thermoanaerobaculia bacterium]